MLGLVVEEESDDDYYDDVAEFSFLQRGTCNTVPVGWILINSKSTSNILIITDFIKKIFHSNGTYINIHCNAGMSQVTKEATLKDCGTAWFNEGAISNILYLHKVKHRFLIHYDCDEGVFSIHKP